MKINSSNISIPWILRRTQSFLDASYIALFFYTILLPYGCSETNNPATQYRLRYAITENQPDNLRIGKLDDDLIQTPEIRTTELFTLFHSSKYGTLRYKLREASQYFNLDEQTSILSAKQSIDLEALCPRYCREGATRAQLIQHVNIWYEHRLVALVQVEVTVIDVDDNPPKFPSTIPRPYVFRLKEVIYRAGQQVELPKALDSDVQPDHAEIAYRLESFPDDRTNALEVFHLFSRNDSRLMLVLQRDLDYEDVKLYRFYLIAWSPRIDERSRKHSLTNTPADFQDKLEVRIEVLNINDISPVFSKSLYTIKLSEDTPIGSVIYKLEANDRDENSTIRYTMEGALDPEVDKLFQLDPDGNVRLIGSLDYELREKYAFSARASDGEFFALTRLEIVVNDVNDELPEFISHPSRLVIEENEASETFVGKLLIIDRDSPEVNGQVNCQEPEHVAGKQALLFQLQTDTTGLGHSSGRPMQLDPSVINSDHRVYQRFDLYSSKTFDRESEPHVYESLLVCWDGLSSESTPYEYPQRAGGLTGTLTISLTVTDRNDNMPTFEKQQYDAELKENSPIGTKVIQVHATDLDSEPHAKPRYRLLHNELFTSHFEVEPETGWIVTYADIDREAQSTYQLTVLAIDGWQDDFPSPNNHVVLSRKTTTATQYTATTRVQIRVLDENDNAPEFRGPRQFAVEENQPPQTWIGDLQIMDRDEGVNREVEFILTTHPAINEQSSTNITKLNGNLTKYGKLPIRLALNGSLYTTEKLDRENQSHHCFEVTVRDRAPRNPLSSTDTICVRVLDLNDNAPRFKRIKGSLPATHSRDNQTSYDAPSSIENLPETQIAKVDELSDVVIPISIHESPGYCALIAEGEDVDEGRNALLRYDIKSPNQDTSSGQTLAAFMVDPQSGRMMLARHLSIEEIGTHSITLTVEDSGSPVQSAELVVQLQIEDSPARGNWLLPETDSTRGTSPNSRGDYSEAHTILIVIVLCGISAFLAAVLISAILCMIKPCRGGSQSRDGARFPKGTGSGHVVKYGADGNVDDKVPGSYTDYSLGVLDVNGYATNANGTLQPRTGAHLIAAQIPGLDQLYLPSDKLIGVEASFQTCGSTVDDASWQRRNNIATLLKSPQLDRLSPTSPMFQFNTTQSIENNWFTASQPNTSIWSPVAIGTNAHVGYNAHCTDCHEALIEPTSPLHVAYVSTSSETQSTVNPFQPAQFFPSLVSDRGGRDCAEYDGSDLATVHQRLMLNANTHVVTVNNGVYNQGQASELPNGCDRQPIGEEQRSDSGRGASDEEITNQTLSGPQTKFRSATLRYSQDNTSHVMQGLVFPSLPRINSVNATCKTASSNLTTFDSTRTTQNSTACDSAEHEQVPTKVAVIRFPKSHVF